MELHHLRYFLAIADHSSIAEASKRLHVSQSAMSVALRDLERELGFPLFDREGRRLRINRNGRYFADQVRAAFATISDAQASIASDVEKRQCTVNCATNMTLGRVGEVLIRAFRETHPGTVLRIGFKGSLTFKHATPDLEFFGTPREFAPSERLVKIGHERFVAVFPAERALPAGAEVRLADLRDEPFVLPGPGEMQNVIKAMFTEAGFEPNVVSEIQLYSEVCNLVRAGMGFTIAPELTWLDSMWGLSAHRIADVERGRNIYAFIPSSAASSPAAFEFLAFLRQDADRLLAQEQRAACA